MTDILFGEVDYEEDYAYIAHKNLVFGGKEKPVDIYLMEDDEEEGISQFQRDAYDALMSDWDQMQHKIAEAILNYYNGSEKGAYGPDDEEEFKEWWPDIDTEEELFEKIHLEMIVIDTEFVMESKGENPVYILFNRDWGGEDLDDNGVAVLIEDGEVTEVDYKYIAF